MAKPTSASPSATRLLLNYHKKPSIALRNQLVRLHLGLVRKVAHRLARQCKEPYEDLVQCGCLGLIAAIERFDPSQGYAFSSFAVPYIRGEILHFLRDRAYMLKIPRRWQQLNQDGQKIREELAKVLDRPPTEDQVASQLQVSPEEWRSVRLAMRNRTPLSINTTLSTSAQAAGTALTLADLLVDAQEEVRQSQTEDSLELYQALAQLEERTRQMIEEVFLHHLTRQEVASRKGVSPITVSRHIQKGIEQLMNLLQSPLAAAKG